MANIEFGIYTQKEPINLNLRFYHNKIDVNTKTNIFLFEKDFRFKKIAKGKKSSRSIDITNDSIKEKTEKLKRIVFEKFAEDFPKGNPINSNWLIKIINEFHERPSGEDDPKYYFVPFCEQHIEVLKTRINPKSGKLLDPKTLTRYKYSLSKVKEFEEYKELKLRTTDINLDFHNDFLFYCKEECLYSNTTIKKFLTHICIFVNAAEEKGYKINREAQSSKFTIKEEEIIDTYLNKQEIDLIYNYDLSDNERLDNVRDLFITGLWTGLRISDLKRINSFDFSSNRIKIIETDKTDSFVLIPIHPQLKNIHLKRNGIFPEISSQKFNLYVKELCQLVGINEMTLGTLKNPKTNRNEKGLYPKYQLISSHHCRKSFVTNHYGNIDDKTLMAITTHKSPAVFLDYVKTSKREHADRLEKYWEEQENKKEVN